MNATRPLPQNVDQAIKMLISLGYPATVHHAKHRKA